MNALSFGHKKKNKFAAPIAIGIVALIVVGVLLSRAGLDKALVKQKLDETIANLKEKGREHGRDIDVTYGELEVAGSFLSRHVVIHDPALHIRPLTPAPKLPSPDKPKAAPIAVPDNGTRG